MKIEPHLGDCKTVLISPDGRLGTFPFGALPGKKLGSYLIEEYKIALIPTPTLLPELVRVAAASETPGADGPKQFSRTSLQDTFL